MFSKIQIITITELLKIGNIGRQVTEPIELGYREVPSVYNNYLSHSAANSRKHITFLEET